MRTLCLNVGSSTLKWSLLELPNEAPLAGGTVPLGPGGLDLGPVIAAAGHVDGVAHRVVHGGDKFRETTRVDARVEKALEDLAPLDPLHLPRALQGLRAAREAFPAVPHYACFDTAFHRTLPESAYLYAVPDDWTRRYGLRRFGFHGLSVAHATRRATALLGNSAERLLVCHLGSGSSITAVLDGASVDTTMGFTALEGLPMATRSGTIDPEIVLFLQRQHGLTVDALEQGLQEDSGLRGLFGGTGDLREVMAARARGEAHAERAYGVFLTGVRRGLGAMLGSLGGLDALVFTGGIGEHQPDVRADLVSAFAWLGLALDSASNAAPQRDATLSTTGSRVKILRVEAREDVSMALDVAALSAG